MIGTEWDASQLRRLGAVSHSCCGQSYAWWWLLSDLPGGLFDEVYSNKAIVFTGGYFRFFFQFGGQYVDNFEYSSFLNYTSIGKKVLLLLIAQYFLITFYFCASFTCLSDICYVDCDVRWPSVTISVIQSLSDWFCFLKLSSTCMCHLLLGSETAFCPHSVFMFIRRFINCILPTQCVYVYQTIHKLHFAHTVYLCLSDDS